MAASTHAAFKERRAALVAGMTRYQRGDRTISLQKSRRRRVLRLRHVLGLLALAVGFFFVLERAYVFLISWEELAIRTVIIRGQDEPLSSAIARDFEGRRLGNIFLFDINTLRQELLADSWVRDIRVRKVFPSSLSVDIIARKAFVLFDNGGLSLVDEDGVVLEEEVSAGRWDLPVVRGRGLLGPGSAKRWEAVKSVLAGLPMAERSRLQALESSPYGDVTLLFENDPLRIIVDAGSAAEKLALVRSLRANWEGRFGSLLAADLRFSDRVILSPMEEAGGKPSPNPDKETH